MCPTENRSQVDLSSEVARPAQINAGVPERRCRKEFDKASFASFGSREARKFLGGKHDNGFSAMLCHALRTALPCEAKYLAEARLGILKLPLFLCRLSLHHPMSAWRSHLLFVLPHTFLTTLVRLYRIVAAVRHLRVNGRVFSFTAGPEVKRVIAPKALDRFKQGIREITRRAKSVSMETTMEELARYMRGWRSYFGFCETPAVLIGLTRWVWLRLRAAIWRQWKTPRRRRAALLDLGVRPRLASNTAGSGLGPWYLAKAKALSVGLSNTYFRSLGLPSLFEGVKA